ncbi:NUDIX domain-containing protein [Nocardiopsis sp. NPDC006198]|uniref:NUDIX hydrolase n=1 Tax=Nocardiopsis sp. NPDC006198 TaxID=3154472 RepID=UPI0033B247E2
MGKRIDYYDDPEAPAANSLVPSVNVFVVNERDEVLMIRRTDNDNWAVPGGALDLGESVPAAAVRETLEETGIHCEITGTIGIYSDPKHIIYYTSDGEARQEFSLVFAARPLSGEPTPSDESKEVVWVPKHELTDYRMDRSMRLRVEHFLAGGPTHIG